VASTLKLFWTPIASRHLKSAWEYVAEDSETAADQLLDRILTAVEVLSLQPRLGRTGRVDGTRELVIVGTPFLVSYRLLRSEIHVLAVFHGARQWPENF
jgi:plasmid stabilization system protein ParE